MTAGAAAAALMTLPNLSNGALPGLPDLSTSGVTKVVSAGDDLAVLYNDWSMSATGADGAAVSGSGKAIEIVRRQPDGTWRFVVDDPFGRG